jgi:hypothetical protein
MSATASRFVRVFGSDQDLLLAAVEAGRAAASAHAAQLEALGEYARRYENDEFAHLEVAPLLHISDRAAQTRLGVAKALTTCLTEMLKVLKLGDIDDFKAQMIAEAVIDLQDAKAQQVEARVLPNAPTQTHSQLYRALQKAVLAVDPEAAEQRRQQRKSDRRVSSQPTGDGEAVLSIFHNVATIAAMQQAISGRARQLKCAGNEPRTLAQIEADVAADLVLGGEEHHKVVVHLTLPVVGNEPAEVDGVGPITREAALEMAAEASSWRWLRTDANGVVVDMTAASYKPPAALAEFVKVRDRTCRHPGCIRSARQCDIDHRVPWPQGSTSAGNLQAGCRRHHRAKTHGGWKVKELEPDWVEWISPLGFRHKVKPTPVAAPLADPPPF